MSKTPRLDVRDKVVVITGGGQGIGLALAERLSAQGARLALIDINAETLADAVRRLGPDRALAITADVRDRAAMAAATKQVIGDLGGIDVVVANAGVTPPPATLRTVDLDAFDRVIDINVTGVLNTVRPALEEIIARRGHVSVVGSCAAFSPGVAGSAYMISKAAAEQMGRALRLELAPHGATAGVTYFGLVETDLARATLDDDPLGARVGQLLPWPLNRRMTADAAAKVLEDGIAARSARVVAPKAWVPYAVLRGALNGVLDERIVRDKKVHELVHDVERRELDTP